MFRRALIVAKTASLVALASYLAGFAPSALATTTINTYGNIGGSERCLVGDAGGLCTKGGAYLGALSITRIYEINSARTLTRIDDDLDRIWSSAAGYIEVREYAHYLKGQGTSLAGVGTSPASFLQFPTDTPIATSDLVVGPAVASDTVASDYVTGASFLSLAVGGNPFSFIYKSQGQLYSSDNHAGSGFANGLNGVDDHMVSWSAGTTTDSQGRTANVFLIAFERSKGWDVDFQDGVYEVLIPTALAPVPEPSTYALMLAGLCTVAGAMLRRRARYSN